MSAPRILYCHCTHAQVVPKEVKEAVLKKLCDSGVSFETVADLCEMSARQDAALHRLADGYKDPKTGACTALSSALHIEFARANLIHPQRQGTS